MEWITAIRDVWINVKPEFLTNRAMTANNYKSISHRLIPASALALILALALAGCLAGEDRENVDSGAGGGSVGPADNGAVPTVWADIATIFSANCSACHSGSTPFGVVSLDSDQYSNLVDNLANTDNTLEQYIVSGDSMASYLYLAISGGISGDPNDDMSSNISTDDVITIETWIDSGALEN